MKKEHLPIFGVGPFYGAFVVGTTVIGTIASVSGRLNNGLLHAFPAVLFCIISGTVLVIFGLCLWWPTAFGKKSIVKYIRGNSLCTSGVYRYVRNPCYSGLTLAFIGILLIVHNLWLWIFPVIYWIVLTILLKHSEEKWLLALYGESYAEYCKTVNRCIPWFPKKGKAERTHDSEYSEK